MGENIDCLFYKEIKSRQGTINCWEDTGWDENFCNVPGATHALCCTLKTKNGWKGKTFRAKINQQVMSEAVDKFILEENASPKTLMRRIGDLEAKIEKLLSED